VVAVLGELLPVELDEDFEDFEDSEGFGDSDDLDSDDELVVDSFAPDSLPARLSVR
jgi:hypothetical protein